MAVLHDFICHACNVVFEDVSSHSEALGGVEPVPCPRCEAACGIVWLKAPGMNGDENLSAEEKVAAALKIGFDPNGKLTIPQTRSDLKKIRAALGDFKVGAKELMSSEKPNGDTRTTAEREAAKAQTVDFIRHRRAKIRAGEVPRHTADAETRSAMESTPMNERRILAKKGA